MLETDLLVIAASHRPPQDQIDEMTSFLKERGELGRPRSIFDASLPLLSSLASVVLSQGLLTFIKTYVLQLKIPILYLLFAFDVTLVRPSPFSLTPTPSAVADHASSVRSMQPKLLRNPEIDDFSLLPVLKMALSRV